MFEGFVHLKRQLPREDIKKIVIMGYQYKGYSKSILFFIKEDSVDDSLKEHLLRKFGFIKEYIDKIIVFLNDKADKSKTLIFNYENG